MDLIEALDAELELITSSLLTAETLTASEPGTWPRTFDITSDDSKLSLHAILLETYPAPGSVSIDVKGKEMGRDEAEEWREWVREKMGEWDADEEWVDRSLVIPRLKVSGLPCSSFSQPTSFPSWRLPLQHLLHRLLLSLPLQSQCPTTSFSHPTTFSPRPRASSSYLYPPSFHSSASPRPVIPASCTPLATTMTLSNG